MYLRAWWTVNVGFLVLDWLIKIFNLYVNAVRPHIIGIPAPWENNKLRFNAAIISIYGTLKVVVGGPWKQAYREKPEIGWDSCRTCGFLPGPSTGRAGNTTWWYPVHDQGVSQVQWCQMVTVARKMLRIEQLGTSWHSKLWFRGTPQSSPTTCWSKPCVSRPEDSLRTIYLGTNGNVLKTLHGCVSSPGLRTALNIISSLMTSEAGSLLAKFISFSSWSHT